jgi:glucokinase
MTEIFNLVAGNRQKERPLIWRQRSPKAALVGGDFLRLTVNLFVSAWCRAGNPAPALGTLSGRRIAPKIARMLQQGTFMKAFCSKGRMRPLLEKIPVHVILDPKVALIGAALTAVREK